MALFPSENSTVAECHNEIVNIFKGNIYTKQKYKICGSFNLCDTSFNHKQCFFSKPICTSTNTSKQLTYTGKLLNSLTYGSALCISTVRIILSMRVLANMFIDKKHILFYVHVCDFILTDSFMLSCVSHMTWKP